MIDPTGGPGQVGQSDPTVVYDGGVARIIKRKSFGAGFTNSASQLLPAVAGMKLKVVAVTCFSYQFTAAGLAYLTSAAGDFFLGYIGALGTACPFPTSSHVIYETNVGGALSVGSQGTMQIVFDVVYYEAP